MKSKMPEKLKKKLYKDYSELNTRMIKNVLTKQPISCAFDTELITKVQNNLADMVNEISGYTTNHEGELGMKEIDYIENLATNCFLDVSSVVEDFIPSETFIRKQLLLVFRFLLNCEIKTIKWKAKQEKK
jgi:hypothetical protein